MGQRSEIETIVTTRIQTTRRAGLAADLTALATVPLFTITGGDIIVDGFHGKVTTVIGAGATTLALTLTEAVAGTVVPIAAACASIANQQVNSVFTIAGPVAGLVLLHTGAARGVGIYQATNRLVLVPGSIGLVVGAFVSTGIIDWFLRWSPCVPQSNVVAA